MSYCCCSPRTRSSLGCILWLTSSTAVVSCRSCSSRMQRAPPCSRGLHKCLDTLAELAAFRGTRWLFFSDHVKDMDDGKCSFLGVPLAQREGESTFKSQATDFIQHLRREISSRFEETHPVAKATWVFDFTAWPWIDEAALMQHGNGDIALLASHLQPKLGPLPGAVSQCGQSTTTFSAACRRRCRRWPDRPLKRLRSEVEQDEGGGGGGGSFFVWGRSMMLLQ